MNKGMLNSSSLIVSSLLLSSTTFIASGSDSEKESLPNVIIVLTDDQGYGEVAAHGNEFIKTPFIDQLYNEGVRLTNFHVNSVSSPTRAALLTGRYSSRVGVWHTVGGRNIVYKEEKMMSDFFKSAGYKTIMTGKWHLGDNYPFRPEDRGFDEVFRIGGGSLGQIGDYWENGLFDGHYWDGTEWIPTKGFSTDVQFERAFDFIEKNKSNPFFAYIATTAPHSPIGAPDKYVQPYLDMGLKENVAKFYGMVTNIDENLGQLRALLKELEIDENTILIFMTDNGTANDKKGDSYNAGMRGKKGSTFDGGHRVPCMVYWPDGDIEGGKEVKNLTAHIDLLPSLLEACSIDNTFRVEFDGKDIFPLLRDTEIEWEDRMIVAETKVNSRGQLYKSSAVISDGWRLVDGKGLYNYKKDFGQKTDVADENPEVVAAHKEFYKKWYSSVGESFGSFPYISVGIEEEVLLSAMDVFPVDANKSGKAVWNQSGVKKAQLNHGVWKIKVEEKANYKISLYRWPPSEKIPILDAPAKGTAMDVSEAYIKIQDFEKTKAVKSKDVYVSFETELGVGETNLDASFMTDNKKLTSAYFVLIEKLNK